MSAARHHQDWMALVEHSGPFLSHGVMMEAFPQGMPSFDNTQYAEVRLAYEEWRTAAYSSAPDQGLHGAWVAYVLREVLELDDLLVSGDELPASFTVKEHQHGHKLRPDFVVCPDRGKPVPQEASFLIRVIPPRKPPEYARKDEGLSPVAQMIYLQQALGVPLGLVTNGEQWVVVFAVANQQTGLAVWNAGLWPEERGAYQSFAALFHSDRFVSVPAEERIAQLFERSRNDQVEVTKRLGDQVRRAVEILIHSVDRIDRERGGGLLERKDGHEKHLYNGALTFMMRLVFLFSAEERKILLPEHEEFQQHYGILGLYDALRDLADQNGEEVLERRHDAYVRLLATFRAVHEGIRHQDFGMPAYGGTLFDPDRYPFLEGRAQEDGRTQSLGEARPLPIDNRTVMHLLQSLQFLQLRLPGTGPVESHRLSFRALSVEQIGHVYEGLLDHTGLRAGETLIGLRANKGRESVHPLAPVERARAQGKDELVELLHELTGRAQTALERDLETRDVELDHLLAYSCDSDEKLVERLRPLAALLECDAFGYPVVFPEGSVYVGAGTDRRSSGTHYTPPSLTEPIVRHTLEPLVYDGPAEGKERAEWKLRTPDEILALKVCDPAMGSGAFLVQACRYLSERLRESWKEHGAPTTAHPTLPLGGLPEGQMDEEFLAAADGEQRIQAMRLIAERCLYGVDINPMAVEMAKLSLWLETAQKNRPFTFLDHALKCGDSLLGVGRDFIESLVEGRRKPRGDSLYDDAVVRSLAEASDLRLKIEAEDDADITVIHRKEAWLRSADAAAQRIKQVADYMTGALLLGVDQDVLLERAGAMLAGGKGVDFAPAMQAAESRRAFIWFAEFPEVFDGGGFHAIVGNPPFMGGKKLTGHFSPDYREYLVKSLAGGVRGVADLCAYFYLRAFALLRWEGTLGLLATNTIAQGDTREVGLDRITEDGGIILRANPSRPWPGEAGVHVAAVWIRKGPWKAPVVLESEVMEERALPALSPFLTAPGRATGNPHRLKANEGLSYVGSYVLGMGFVLEPEEAQDLILKGQRNKHVLYPYMNGQDLNSRPDQSASRWVINFFDWPLDRSASGSWFAGIPGELAEAEREHAARWSSDGTPSSGFTFYEHDQDLSDAVKQKRRKWLRAGRVPRDYPYPVAADYPDLLRIVEQRAKPDRDRLGLKKDSSAQGYGRFWWRYGRTQSSLYAAIAGRERVLATAQTSRRWEPAWIPKGTVFTHSCVIFPDRSDGFYAVMQSIFHEEWRLEQGPSLKGDARYTPSDCFETFPFPSDPSSCADVGKSYDSERRALLGPESLGLTALYNRFHDEEDSWEPLSALRVLHARLDNAVRDAYGWSDLDLEHGFHETKQGIRFTISERARVEVLDRLLELNHQRYAEEVAAGLHEEKGGKGKAAARKKRVADEDDGQGRMF